MVLPSAPSLAAAPKTTELSEQERESDEGVPASDDQGQNLEVDDPNNSETESKAVVKNGSDEKNGSDAVESLDSNTIEDVKIKREDIVAQVWKFSHNQIIICRLVFLKNSEFSSSHFGWKLLFVVFVLFCFKSFAFITKHNSTKYYLQCKTHYATLLTEQYLWYLRCRLLMLAIQYWIWLLTKI